ncbi:hypothetical protein L226DRAFT_337927 [Lentinus tigrinus ALCF2SS1-7]|uniref:uncharacterized protein n=1 Tax=Lentinus tigrinus ALCF2SS1-7 TaxID=1328758 RepID=UPI0011660CA2|nr:hypothetical protein L226DRAFT_337927 [Lentinus tigrinus ALCF2SS1-7]
MHQVRRGMQHRHRRVQGLEERDPALIDLPFSLPSIPLLSPLLDPILTPIIAGKPRTTSTSSQHATTSTTPTQAPTPTSTPTTASPSNPASPSSSGNGSSGDPQGGESGNNGSSNGASHSNGSDGSNPSPAATSPTSPSASSADSSGSSNPSGSSPDGSDAGSDPSATGSSPQGLSDASSTGNLSVVINANGDKAFVTVTSSSDAAGETGSSVSVTGSAARVTSVATAGHGFGTSTGLYPGETTGTSSAGTSNPTGTVESASRSHGVSTGIIVAISVIAALLALMLLLCCVRRRAVAARINRRKQWFAGGGSDAQRDYSDKDGPAPGTQSNRSSFATSFDRGQVFTPNPNPFDVPVSVSIQQTTQVWPSDLSGSITVVPAAAHTVESASSPTFRSQGDRSSVHSASSAGGSRPASQNSQYLVALPPAAATEGSPYGLDCSSPFSVRPFSPSETFSFPKPPMDDAESRASEIVSGSVKSSMLGSAFYTAEEAHSPLAENENPFADFTEIIRPQSASTENSVPQHFTPVETIQRSFVPSMDDEMAVNPGDEVRVLKRFDDGWAVAEKVGAGVQGLIPVDCMRAVEEELPAFLAKKRISSYRARSSVGTRLSVLSGGSGVGAAM